MIRRIYMVGSSGAGKSTLAKDVSARLGWKYVPLSAGAAYSRHGATFESAEADPALMQKIQEQICVDAATTIFAATSLPDPFVADRAVDYGAYTNLMCQPTQNGKDAVRVMALRLRSRDALVCFCRPFLEALNAARSDPDARRNKFLTDEWVYRVDGAVLYYLRDRDIPFVEVGAGTFEERAAQVVSLVRRPKDDELAAKLIT